MRYLLHHRQTGKWIVVSNKGMASEMGTGLYDQCKGPYDDATVDVAKEHKAENQKELIRYRQPPPSVRSHEEIMQQVARVRKAHIRI